MEGYIKLHRKIIDWEWYTDVNTKCLFLHLMLMANHSDQKWRGETIKKGEFVTSLSHLSVQTGLSVQQVRTSLKKLQKTGDVTIKTTNKNTVIMVVKYDFYQSDKQIKNKQNTFESASKDKANSDEENVVMIIDFLNQTIGARYTYKNKLYNEMITSRLKDGYTIDDFKEVIKKKADEWIGTEMEKYLTPTTLFRPSNFEKYLNQKITTKNETKKVPDWYSQTDVEKPDDDLLKKALDRQRLMSERG